VFFSNYVNYLAEAGFTATDDVVSVATTGTDIDVYEFDVRPETSSLTITYQSDPANGTTFFEQSLSLTFQKFDSTDIADIRSICQGRPNVWVLDNNLNLFLIGAVYGCNVQGGNLVTGQGFGDLNGYTIDLVGREQNPVYVATATQADAFAAVDGIAVTPN
jgi:hypothetical protein